MTELILENTLANYDPEEVVALLSCFVFQEKTDVEPTLSPNLEAGRDAILKISDRVGRIQDQHKVAEDLRSDLKFGLVEVVYEWAKGMVSCHLFIQSTIKLLAALRTDHKFDGRRRRNHCQGDHKVR